MNSGMLFLKNWISHTKLVFTDISWSRIQRKAWCKGLCAGVDYNITLCPLQSRLQHIYTMGIGQPFAKVDLNLMPTSTSSPVRDLGFGLWIDDGSIWIGVRRSDCEKQRGIRRPMQSRLCLIITNQLKNRVGGGCAAAHTKQAVSVTNYAKTTLH